MFDADFFFGRGFLERVQEFHLEHEHGSLRVEIVTVTGERIDTLQLKAVENGARLYTREDRLVFLPYEASGIMASLGGIRELLNSK